MNTKTRKLLIASTFFFWLCFIPLSIAGIITISIFGLAAGFLVARAKPLSELNWPNRTAKTILYSLGAALSVVVCICASGYFYSTWQQSAALKSILTQFISNPNACIMVITVMLGLVMLPSVFDMLCRALFHSWEMLRRIDWSFLWKYTVKTVTAKSLLKNAVLVTVTLLLCVSIGVGLLTAVYCIPVDSIDQHVAQSALTIQKEGTYPFISTWFFSRLDNCTDSITLMEAAIGKETSALEAAINTYHGSIENAGTYAQILVAHYVDGKPYDTYIEYCRYWHGYLVLIKPLLCFMDYNAIRILNGITQVLLITAICWLMFKRGLKEYITPFLLTYLMLMPVALAASIQFSTCFYTFILGILALLLIGQDKLERYAPPLFLLIGIAVAYVDFLTYPIATFGVPVLMLLLLQNSRSLEEKLFLIVKCGIFWCIGFGGMWVSKFIISRLVCGYSFSRIMNMVASDSLSKKALLPSVEASNLTTFLHTPVSWLVILVIDNKFQKIRKNTSINQHEAYRTVFPYLLISLVPFVWYAFATVHSAAHYWFTNKACAVSLLGILFAITSIQASRNKQPS